MKKIDYVSDSLGDLLRPEDFESHTLTTQPLTLNGSQTLVTNKAENRCYKISNALDRDYRKSATKNQHCHQIMNFYLRIRLEKNRFIKMDKVANLSRTIIFSSGTIFSYQTTGPDRIQALPLECKAWKLTPRLHVQH